MINFLSGLNKKIIVDLTTYTAKIETDKEIFYFLKGNQSKRTFALYNMLKKEIDCNFFEPIEEIERNELKYYQLKVPKDNKHFERVYNIDLKAAYPTILYNIKIINLKLYKYMMFSDKEERLASIGMLASKHDIYEIDKGIIKEYNQVISDYSKYFYFCVKSVYEIIDNLKSICGNSFIFSWVDGIYFTQYSKIKYIRHYLKSIGFKYSIDKLYDFSHTIKKDHIEIKFIKDDETKIFNIPINNKSKNLIIQNFLK